MSLIFFVVSVYCVAIEFICDNKRIGSPGTRLGLHYIAAFLSHVTGGILVQSPRLPGVSSGGLLVQSPRLPGVSSACCVPIKIARCRNQLLRRVGVPNQSEWSLRVLLLRLHRLYPCPVSLSKLTSMCAM